MSDAAVTILMVSILVVIVAIDVWLDHSKRGNTFSTHFRALGRAWPPARILIVVGVGILLGHLYWTPQDVHDSGGVKLCPCVQTP